MDWERLLSVVFVLVLLGIASWGSILAYWSRHWPSVKGKIEVSLLDGDSHELAYSYMVDGRGFIGSDVKPWGSSNWRLTGGDDDAAWKPGPSLWSGARDKVRRYPPGATVIVYYNPHNPKWSCLERGGFLFPLFLGAIAVIFGFSLI
jgi:hypothetical protein